MISKRMQEALNAQIGKEIYSAYVYLQMSARSAEEGLPGLSSWFRRQFEEELQHGLKIMDHLADRDAAVRLKEIRPPPTEFKAPLEVFEKVLHHEQEVSRSIHALVGLAAEEKDVATEEFLQWFVREQVEEEASVQKIIDRLELIGDSGSGMYLLDAELGKRGEETED
jgi:ferritin